MNWAKVYYSQFLKKRNSMHECGDGGRGGGAVGVSLVDQCWAAVCLWYVVGVCLGVMCGGCGVGVFHGRCGCVSWAVWVLVFFCVVMVWAGLHDIRPRPTLRQGCTCWVLTGERGFSN